MGKRWRLSPDTRGPLAVSLVLHAVLIGLFSLSWHSVAEVPKVPRHIGVVAVSADQLPPSAAEIKARKQEEEARKAKEALKRKLERQRQLEAERKRKAAERKKAEEKKKAEARKKAEAERKRKEALALKKKQEETRRKAEEAARRKAEAERKQREEEARRLAEKQRQEVLRREEEALLKAQAEAARKRLEAEEAERAKARAAQQLAERERYIVLIRRAVERSWRKPTDWKPGLVVDLRIELLPTGELKAARVERSSGNAAFDRSALNAANAVTGFPVPKDRNLFEREFRSFVLRFNPEG